MENVLGDEGWLCVIWRLSRTGYYYYLKNILVFSIDIYFIA